MNRREPELLWGVARRLVNANWLKDLGWIVAVAATYLGAGELGLKLEALHPGIAPIWPASGVALVALILLGYRFWPAIAIASLLLGFTLPGNPWTIVAISIGHVLEGLAAAYLVNKYARGAKAFDTAQDVFRFVFYACILSPAISATTGAASFYVSGMVSRGGLANVWVTWWVANGSGCLLVAPFLLVLFDRPHHRLDGREIFELTWLVLGLILIATVTFGPLSVSMNKNQVIRAWMCIPFLIWAGFRFCQLEVAGLTILLFGMAVSGTAYGFGYFAGPDFHVSLLNLDAFIGVIGTMSLAIAALVAERRGAVTKLLGIQSLLQEAVAGKDRDLTATVEALHTEVVEHLESERALRASHERLRLQMDKFVEVFWVYDVIAGRILYVSPAYETLWGRSCDSLYADAHSWLDAVHPEDHHRVFPIIDGLDERDRFAVEYRIVRPDGSIHWICDRGFLIRDKTGRTCCVAGIASEIKEKKIFAQSFVTAQREERERKSA